MFKFLKKPFEHSDLLTSELHNERTFYDAFAKDVDRAKQSIIIESPYLTEWRATQFSKLFKRMNRQGVKIVVNTRNPRHHSKTLEIQAWKAVAVLRNHGVKVRVFDDLRHRKLAIIDNCIAWEGSLNILSQNNSKEIMRRTNSSILAKQLINFTYINRGPRWYNLR